LAAARSDGIEAPSLEILSSYRTRDEQEALREAGVKKYGSESAARKWVAPPGGSGHEKGRAVDFNIGNLSFSELGKMKEHPAYLWLKDNASRYGWVPYSAEPWHWEYKGSF